MTFSERHGYAKTPPITIREDAPNGLRSIMIETARECGISYESINSIVCRVLPADPEGNWGADYFRKEILQNLEGCPWYKVYDVAESILSYLEKNLYRCQPDKFIEEMNKTLIKMGIGWELKLGEGIVYRGDDTFQSSTAETAKILDGTGRKNAASEIKEAIRDISRRPDPDITGAISHAMNALECVAQNILGSKDTLGKIAKNLDLPKPLDEAVNKLYGFSSQHGRHVSEESHPTFEDSELIVHLSCALCTYLAKKHNSPLEKMDLSDDDDDDDEEFWEI